MSGFRFKPCAAAKNIYLGKTCKLQPPVSSLHFLLPLAPSDPYPSEGEASAVPRTTFALPNSRVICYVAGHWLRPLHKPGTSRLSPSSSPLHRRHHKHGSVSAPKPRAAINPSHLHLKCEAARTSAALRHRPVGEGAPSRAGHR